MASPIVVMGVSGSGKSTVGAALAQRLRVPFADADDFHPPANIAKMTAGQALDDDDRYPWLEAIGQWLAQHGEGGVMSCSALRGTAIDVDQDIDSIVDNYVSASRTTEQENR
jgi:gluconokinase